MTLALLVACGPPGIGPGTESGTEGKDETEEGEDTQPDPPDLPDPSTSDTSETDDSLTFVPPPPDQPWHCDPFAQDCPEGEKCVPYSTTGGTWDANKCVPVLGEQATGEPCTYGGTVEATDDCDETGICWNVKEVDGEVVGTCHAFCTGTADDPMCPEGASCLIPGDGVINLCIPSCDPIVQDCGPGQACYWANSDFSCIFTTEDIPAGQPCGFINDCAAGLICLTAEVFPACEGAACCSTFCDLGRQNPGPDPCAAVPGTSCVPFFEQGMAPPGYEHIGVCILPEAGP